MSRWKLVATSLVALCTFPLAAAAQAAGEQPPGTFKIPGTDSTLRVYGYVELDATYDFDGDIGDLAGTDFASLVEFQPLDAGETEKRRLYYTMRTSRIGLTSTTPTGMGALTTRIEADFNSPSPNNWSSEATTNGVTFRLRHAYGQLGGLLIGQTWTNFADLASYPDTVDFNPHGAIALIRQPMVKYQLGLGRASLGLALESPQSIVTNVGVRETTGRTFDQLPDLTANLTYTFSFGHVNLRGLGTQYRGRLPATTTAPAGPSDNKFGWGAGVSGSIKFGPENFIWSVQGGDGIGRYQFSTFFQTAALTGATGAELDTWRSLAYHVGLTHTWIPDRMRSNVIWTQTFIDDNDTILAAPTYNGSANRRIDVLFVNTFVSPVKNVEVGLEYAFGRRYLHDAAVDAPGVDGGDRGTQHRANALVRFGFY